MCVFLGLTKAFVFVNDLQYWLELSAKSIASHSYITFNLYLQKHFQNRIGINLSDKSQNRVGE